MSDDAKQNGWIVGFLIAAGVFFYFGGEMLAKHTAWSDFQSPAGVGEIFGLLGSVVGAVGTALKIDLPSLLSRVKGS